MTDAVPTDHLGHQLAQASRERVAEALDGGGYARVTLRSLASGRHTALSFSAKRKAAGGGYTSRRFREGRVGLKDAAVVFIDDPYGEAVARFDPTTGVLVNKTEDQANLWSARVILRWIRDDAYELEALAEIFISLSCSVCGRRLWDPESIERGIGPECYGQRTKSRHA